MYAGICLREMSGSLCRMTAVIPLSGSMLQGSQEGGMVGSTVVADWEELDSKKRCMLMLSGSCPTAARWRQVTRMVQERPVHPGTLMTGPEKLKEE